MHRPVGGLECDECGEWSLSWLQLHAHGMLKEAGGLSMAAMPSAVCRQHEHVLPEWVPMHWSGCDSPGPADKPSCAAQL
jgi:hypothetical protein